MPGREGCPVHGIHLGGHGVALIELVRLRDDVRDDERPALCAFAYRDVGPEEELRSVGRADDAVENSCDRGSRPDHTLIRFLIGPGDIHRVERGPIEDHCGTSGLEVAGDRLDVEHTGLGGGLAGRIEDDGVGGGKGHVSTVARKRATRAVASCRADGDSDPARAAPATQSTMRVSVIAGHQARRSPSRRRYSTGMEATAPA